MGREVRRVPALWQHPKDGQGSYIPLHQGGFEATLARWQQEAAWWAQGFRWHHGEDAFVRKEADMAYHFEEWAGACPQQPDYMPTWSPEQATHYQMYESTTEGTPISPVMASPEALAHWLAGHKTSAFAGQTASYEAWLAVCHDGWAPNMVLADGQIMSGVAFAQHTVENEGQR